MMLTSTRPGPELYSCAYARLEPATNPLTTTTKAAIQRFMCSLLECPYCDSLERCPQSGRSAISESVIGVTAMQRIRTRTISSFWTMHPSTVWPRLKGVLFHPGSTDNEERRFDHWRKTVAATTDQVT